MMKQILPPKTGKLMIQKAVEKCLRQIYITNS